MEAGAAAGSGIVSIIGMALSVVSLVCLIMVLIPIFKQSVGLGILGVLTCGIFAFIYGWIKVKEYNIQKVMLIWTIVVVVSIVMNVVYGVAMFSAISSQGA